MKKIIALVLCLIVILSTWQMWKLYKRGKRHERHRTESAFSLCSKPGNQPANPEMVNIILQQPFYYLGKGRQSYVFESRDGKWVIKFFQQKRLTADSYLSWLPDQFLVNALRKRKKRLKEKRTDQLLLSHEIALETLPEETGIVYAHLGFSDLPGTITLLDRRGNIVVLAADRTQFVLQQKAAPLKQTIFLLMSEGRMEEAKKRIHDLFDLLERCQERKIWDRDKALIRNGNVGLVEGRAIYIDTGKLSPFEKAPFEKDNAAFYRAYDMQRLRPLQKWLETNYPELSFTFNERARRFTNLELQEQATCNGSNGAIPR